jgi:hypothetical protein
VTFGGASFSGRRTSSAWRSSPSAIEVNGGTDQVWGVGVYAICAKL